MKRLSFAAAIAATLLASTAGAEVITVANPSFEEPALADGIFTIAAPPGWILTGGANAGVWNPAAGQNGVTSDFLAGTVGHQIAYSNGPNIRQDLSIDVGYGYLYTLTVKVGGRDGAFSDEPFGVLLRATTADPNDGGALVSLKGVFGRNLAGGWEEQTVEFEAIDPAVADQQLIVVLVNNGTRDEDPATNGSQINFDDVRLSRAKLASCEGFFSPFAEPLSLSAKNKRAIPVKMRLYDYAGNELTDADFAYPPVANVSFMTGNNGAGAESDAALTVQSDDSNAFRYDTNEGQWILNLAAKQYSAAGTYTVSVVSGDSGFAISSLGSCSQDFVRR